MRAITVVRWIATVLSALFAVATLVGTPTVLQLLSGEPLSAHPHYVTCGQAAADHFSAPVAYAFGLLLLPIAFGLITRRLWVHRFIRIYVLGALFAFVIEVAFSFRNILAMFSGWDTRALFFATFAMLEMSKVTWPLCLWLTSVLLKTEEEIQHHAGGYRVGREPSA